MDPQQLPLEPLITPPPISWWPLAPIWWILIVIITLLILFIIVRLFAKKEASQKITKLPDTTALDPFRQIALKELSSLTKPYNQAAGEWLQQLNTLLKRICNNRYPADNSKVLLGSSWLKFLDKKCPTAHISQFTVLVDGEYQANYSIDKATIDALNSALEHWITHHV